MISKTHRLTPFYIFVSAVAFLFMVAVAPSLLAVDDAQVTQAESNPVAQEECWVMLVEPVETKHTGDVMADRTRSLDEQLAGSGLEGA